MDSKSTTTQSELKCIVCDENAEPKALSLTLLEEITNGFSEDREIGKGGFAVVYKGILDNEATVAVKRLSDSYMYFEKQFHREIECLIKVKHTNVVRFIGYCADSQGRAGNYNGKFVMADVQQRLLCFEYLPHGTLHKYIKDASCGLDWRTRYNIINGICDGLHYLHQNRIVHMDLKPPNILLDSNMSPKIADFGLSRCFEEMQSHAITSKICGTLGYLAPEFTSCEITYQFDLYSLGVIIIEILTGKKGYKAVEDVLESWRNRLEESHKDIQLEQVRLCTVIAIECMEFNPAKRPASMQHIIARLHEIGNIEGSIETVVTRSSALEERNMNTFPQYAQDPNDRHAEQMYHGSTFNQDIVSATPSNYFPENAGPREAIIDDEQFYRSENQAYSADGDPLPGIEGFQIVGEPRPGITLTACGFPTNGTTLCNFQWVRCLEDGTRHSIEGATMYDYVVTADDVGTLLAVDCTPMDDNGRQGDLVRKFANDENKISCDPDMQNEITTCISRGRADFDVYVLQGYSPDEWEQATLVLRRTGYQINFSHKDEVFIEEKYSPNLQAKIPNGRTTQFVLVSSGGVNIPFNTQGITEPNNEDNDVRLRDLIVLVMRTFQNKALDAKRKGKA